MSLSGQLFADLPIPEHFSPARAEFQATCTRPEAQSALYWARQLAHAPTSERREECRRMMMLASLAMSRDGNEHLRFIQ